MEANIDENIKKWEKDIIDTSKNNKLLYFDNKNFLRILSPSMAFLFDDIVNKDKKMIFKIGNDENRKKDEIIISKRENILKSLNEIFYNSGNALKEHGSNVLYLSFGVLKWFDENNNGVETQLFFVPVEINKKLYNNFYIESIEGDIFFNPILKEKLEQFNIKFDFNFDENLNISEAMKFFKLIIKDSNWVINNYVYLGILSFTNNTIYNDIKNNHDLIKNNELTKALAGDLNIIKKLNEKMPEKIDYSIDTIMDADSSQLNAIYAARCGASFILNGPPGTGKSQTIANIIADSIKNNKSVLFVSEKYAAIDVVKKRLDKLNLNNYILEFYGNKPKSEIIKSLYKSITDNNSIVEDKMPVDRYSDILNNYIKAIHLKREKLNISIYEACNIYIKNKTDLSIKIDDKLLEIPKEDLDNIEFQLSEFDDYIDMIEDYNKIIKSFNINKFRDDSGTFYKVIKDLLLNIDKLLENADIIYNIFGITVENLNSLGIIYNIVNSINTEIVLDSNYFNIDYINESYELIEKYDKIKSEYDYMLEILLKKRSLEFLNLDIPKLRNDFRNIYKSKLKRLSSNYKSLFNEIMDLTVDKSRNNYEDILNDLDYAVKIKDKENELNAINLLMKEKNISADEKSKILYAKSIISVTENNLNDNIKNFFSNYNKLNDILFVTDLYQNLIKNINYFNTMFPDGNLKLLNFNEMKDIVNNVLSVDLERYVKLNDLMVSMENKGIDLSSIIGEKLTPGLILCAFRSDFYKKFIMYYINNDENLKDFRSSSHERIINMFISFDKKRMEINKNNILYNLYKNKMETLSKYPEVSMIIKTENSKKRYQKPVKRLFDEIYNSLFKLKPCIMTSPTNVSSFFNNKIKFDLLIFDEASQLTPPEAVGSLIRANQVIISGDTQQLPPTMFFENINPDKYDEDYVVLNNILDQFDALGLTKIILKWHYRSLDDKLIAFSNKYFYDNLLETFPSAYKNTEETGIKFIYVEGLYSRGKKRDNIAEANEVVNILKEELNYTTSIGIVTLSESQRSAIQDVLLDYSRNDNVLSQILNNDDIFIKNLENVQGDEKDTIILSIGYGKDENGKLTMNFGPINTAGGEKRLNVAITRARKKVIIVSSIKAEDIRLPFNSGKGPELLKKYINFAVNNNINSFKDFNSNDEIINDISKNLEKNGFITEKNIGFSRNNIALAVIDPENQNHYILGIETDGDIYNSMKTVSERERIRNEILKSRGWNLYRVWSIDYIKSRESVLHDIINNINRINFKEKNSAGREI